jgi:hypothetical protein
VEERLMPGPTARRPIAAAALAAILATTAAAAAHAASAALTVSMSVEEQARLGVSTEILTAAAPPSSGTSAARVLDPAPLIQLDAEIAAAEASAAASRARAERTRKRFSEHGAASARAVETAEVFETVDLERLRSAERQLLVEWGEGIARLSKPHRAELLDDIAHGRAELLRVELPPQVSNPKPGTEIELYGGDESQARRGTVLGLLPIADPRLQTRGVLVELRGPRADLAVGELLSARLPGAPAAARGVVVPRGALLRRASHVWLYVQTAPTRFVRREVTDYQPLATGWFVGGGVAPGERIVATGADILLGVETPAAGTAAN